MAEEKEQDVGPETMTVYGLTVGQLNVEREALYTSCEEQTVLIEAHDKIVEDKNALLLTQSDRIVTLEAGAKEAAAKIEVLTKQAADAETKVGKLALRSAAGPRPEMERLPNGSLRLMIMVPEEQAIPLLSWAEGAGEDPQSYVQKMVEEALVSVVSS